MGSLRQVRAQQLVHLEHRRLVLTEHGLELVVGQDRALVGRILQAMGPDVIPDLFHDPVRASGDVPTIAASSFDGVRGFSGPCWASGRRVSWWSKCSPLLRRSGTCGPVR